MTTVTRSSIAIRRRSLAGATALTLVAALLWPSIPAAASPLHLGELEDDLCDFGLGDVEMHGSINAPYSTLTIRCVAKLDLNGHELTVRNVVITTGNQLTIRDSSVDGNGRLTANATATTSLAGIRTTGATLIVEGGLVTASGGFFGAGIGGNSIGTGGTVTISGGTVAASGGLYGAGIGGGEEAAGGKVTISGGTVNASGGDFAAGIGGGYGGGSAGGEATISGGTVDASGGTGIGGGYAGAGGTVQIGKDAIVTATGDHTAIGAGQGSSSFGSLMVAGTLHLPEGKLVIPAGAEVLVKDSGEILGGSSGYTSGASIVGAGRIANYGVIALAAADVLGDGVSVGVTVSGNHYQVAFDADGGTPALSEVTVFASTFKAGYRDFPIEPTRGHDQFLGWADQVDDPVTVDRALPGMSLDGEAVAITAVAQWSTPADATKSTITANPTSITANGTSTSTITVQATAANGKHLITGGDVMELETSAGKLSAVEDNEDGTYTTTLTSTTTPGTATITGTLNSENIGDSATVGLTAVPASTTPIPTTPSPTQPEPVPEPDAPETDAPEDPEGPAFEFEDVSLESGHAESIYRIHQYGITVGTSETTFSPSGDLSRRQMSTFLVRLLMLTDSSIDRPADHEAAMALLVEKGLLQGYANGDLDGSGTLTRGQAASLLVRLVEHVTGETLAAGDLEFSDVARTHTHADNIAKLVEAEVIRGYGDNTFRSGNELRRDQMASLISRTIDLLIASGDIEDLDA